MKNHVQTLLLPLLATAFPVVFLYGQNAGSLSPASLQMPLLTSLSAAAAAYLLCWLATRRPIAASLAAVIFVIFYQTYGYIYRWLTMLDFVTIEHYHLLPLLAVLVGYAAYFLTRLRPATAQAAQKILLIVSSALVAFNLVITVPVEAQKAAAAGQSLIPVASAAVEGKTYPDIYYIVFDEYAGFSAIREYWKDNYVNAFEGYLIEKGFFIADQSRSATLSTVIELSSRLDLWPYPKDTPSEVSVEALRENRVMKILKSYGYSTVAIDMAFQSIQADVSVQYDVSQVGGLAVEAFQKRFVEDTMLLPLQRLFMDRDPSAEKQRDLIFDALDKTVNLQYVDSPKFVYTHILLPHKPFIFEEDGSLLDQDYRDDWSMYLGQHKYATVLARQLIDDILAQADPDNPPVIIFQSDHGARNINARTNDEEALVLGGYLEDYPLDYAHVIINALYLPGFDHSRLNRNIDPIDTFIVVLNHYLDADIKIEDPGRGK